MYHFSTTLNCSMSEAENKVIAALKDEQFGVITEIDVQATVKKKLDIDKKGYKILGACNPKLALQAIEADANIGLLLPCNVLLREEDNGDTTISFMDPVAVLTLANSDDVAVLTKQVKEMLERVCAAL